MARRSRTNSHRPDAFIDELLSPPIVPSPRPLPELRGLAQARAVVKSIEDRRFWYPGPVRPARSLHGGGRIVPSKAPKLAGRFPPSGLSFDAPHKVAVCVRRKERREVLFAMKRTGKGSRSRRRRNKFSNMGC